VYASAGALAALAALGTLAALGGLEALEALLARGTGSAAARVSVRGGTGGRLLSKALAASTASHEG